MTEIALRRCYAHDHVWTGGPECPECAAGASLMKKIHVADVEHVWRMDIQQGSLRIFFAKDKSIACVEIYRGREAFKRAHGEDALVVLREYAASLQKHVDMVLGWTQLVAPVASTEQAS